VGREIQTGQMTCLKMMMRMDMLTISMDMILPERRKSLKNKMLMDLYSFENYRLF